MITQEKLDKLPKNRIGQLVLDTKLYTITFVEPRFPEDFFTVRFVGKDVLDLIEDERSGKTWNEAYNAALSAINKIHLAASDAFIQMFDFSVDKIDASHICDICLEYMPCRHVG